MSETTESTAPPAEAEEPKPAAAEQQAEQQPEPQKSEQETNWERRVNRLTSRVGMITRERDELAQRLAQIERAQNTAQSGQPQPSPEIQQYIRQEAVRLAQEERAQERTRDFHAAGQAAYDDWQERCQNLMAMGADAGLAALLVETPNGAKIAGELHDNPDELERIASIQTERGRAIALGHFAAKLEQRPARTVSRAPRPPQPVTGRANPSFNEYTASAQDLVSYYTKQAQEQQRRQ